MQQSIFHILAINMAMSLKENDKCHIFGPNPRKSRNQIRSPFRACLTGESPEVIDRLVWAWPGSWRWCAAQSPKSKKPRQLCPEQSTCNLQRTSCRTGLFKGIAKLTARVLTLPRKKLCRPFLSEAEGMRNLTLSPEAFCKVLQKKLPSTKKFQHAPEAPGPPISMLLTIASQWPEQEWLFCWRLRQALLSHNIENGGPGVSNSPRQTSSWLVVFFLEPGIDIAQALCLTHAHTPTLPFTSLSTSTTQVQNIWSKRQRSHHWNSIYIQLQCCWISLVSSILTNTYNIGQTEQLQLNINPEHLDTNSWGHSSGTFITKSHKITLTHSHRTAKILLAQMPRTFRRYVHRLQTSYSDCTIWLRIDPTYPHSTPLPHPPNSWVWVDHEEVLNLERSLAWKKITWILRL